MDTNTVHKCVICQGNIEHQKNPQGEVFCTTGQNAWPIADGQCCKVCDDNIVLPIRLKYV